MDHPDLIAHLDKTKGVRIQDVQVKQNEKSRRLEEEVLHRVWNLPSPSVSPRIPIWAKWDDAALSLSKRIAPASSAQGLGTDAGGGKRATRKHRGQKSKASVSKRPIQRPRRLSGFAAYPAMATRSRKTGTFYQLGPPNTAVRT